MNIRLLTLIASPVAILKPFLRHYSSIGVTTFIIYVHVKDDPSILDDAFRIAKPYSNVSIRPIRGEWLEVQDAALEAMRDHPDEWFLVADQDEFQLYPRDLTGILADAARHGFDSIHGCFVDRIAEDGSLRPLDPDASIWTQYPVGAFLTYPVCWGNYRKVVAAKGSVEFTNTGHHEAATGLPYPPAEMLVEVHHFKWVAGLVDQLLTRGSPESPLGPMIRQEAQRFVDYFRSNSNRIALEDPRLMAGPCNPHFANWETIRRLRLND